MTINIKKFHFQLQKKYIAFFTLVPLMLATAFIKVPCPICGGTGKITATGMAFVSVQKIDSTLVDSHTVQGCLNYIAYDYYIVLTVQNASQTQDANGYVQMGLVDYTTSKLLAVNYVTLYAPKGTVSSTGFTVNFTIGLNSPTTTQVQALPIESSIKCQACGGTGKVPLNDVLMLISQKAKYTNVQQISTTPVIVPPVNLADQAEIDIGQEGETDQWRAAHPDGTWN